MKIKNQIKVFHVTQNLDDSFGGPPKSVPYLCNCLNDLFVNTKLLSVKLFDKEFNSVVERFCLNWKSFDYKFFKKLRYSPKMLSYIESNISEITLIHIHNPWNYVAFLVYKVSKKYKLPFLMSARGNFYDWALNQGKLQKFIAWHLFQKDMLNRASCLHATAINEVYALRNIGVTSPIALIPNGIDLSEFENICSKTKSKKNLSLNVSKKYILFISRIHTSKGLHYLVRSFLDLSQKYNNFDLLIVGPTDDFKYKMSLNRLIKINKLDNRVHFLGMLHGADRINVYNASSIFVLPSYTENFGLAIAEAMAAKLPVITTQGTPWQVIEDCDAGWWVELNQKNIDNALSEALSCSEDELKYKGMNGY